jgi:hypothetical protein
MTDAEIKVFEVVVALDGGKTITGNGILTYCPWHHCKTNDWSGHLFRYGKQYFIPCKRHYTYFKENEPLVQEVE